ncbi:hypothetical protein K438DRAFT_1770884 [Mycena galopus ATCC 62051]|nr:hypothetical protein K438DRAFT_1770884 [Mycena galopus ATCC 62051]
MICVNLLSVVLLPLIVRAQTPPVNTPVNIVDFQGNVFGLWVIQQSGSFFNITNPTSTPFLSYSTITLKGDPVFAQLFGQSTSTSWSIVPSGNGLGFNIIEPNSGHRVTSWALQPFDGPINFYTSTPFETSRLEQVFTFAPSTLKKILVRDDRIPVHAKYTQYFVSLAGADSNQIETCQMDAKPRGSEDGTR